MSMIATHISYLVISVAVTIWVARTLRKHGMIYLSDKMEEKPEVAESFSNLLIVIGLIVLGAAVLGATTVLRKGEEGEAWVEEAFEEVDTEGVSDDDLADDGGGTAVDDGAESDSSDNEEE